MTRVHDTSLIEIAKAQKEREPSAVGDSPRMGIGVGAGALGGHAIGGKLAATGSIFRAASKKPPGKHRPIRLTADEWAKVRRTRATGRTAGLLAGASLGVIAADKVNDAVKRKKSA